MRWHAPAVVGEPVLVEEEVEGEGDVEMSSMSPPRVKVKKEVLEEIRSSPSPDSSPVFHSATTGATEAAANIAAAADDGENRGSPAPMDMSADFPASLATASSSGLLPKVEPLDAHREPAHGDELSWLPLHREGDLCADCYKKLCPVEAKRFTAFRIYQ